MFGSRSCIAVLLGIMLSGFMSFADALDISVVSRKNEYVVGEPVVIRVTQKNVGEGKAYAVGALQAGEGGCYSFSSDGTNYSRIVALEMGDPVRGGVSLDQGQSYVYDEVIAYTDEPSGPVFGKPGCYHVRVHDSWVSESFRVVAPTNALDVAAAAAFTDSEVLRCVTPWYRHGAGVSGSGKKKLAEIVGMKAPNFSFHAASSLAEIALESSDPAEALKWAEIADVDGFVLRDRVVCLKLVAYMRLLQIDKAQAQFDRIEKEFPDSAAACMLRRDGERMMSEAKRTLSRQSKEEKVRNESARWKDVPAATRKEIEQTVDTLMKNVLAFDERGIGEMMTDDFVRNGHFNKTQFIEQLRGDVKEAKGKRPEVATRFEQMLTDGSNVVAKMEFAYRGEGREGKKRDRMTFSQRGGKGAWLLVAWDSTPVESTEMEKWREEVVRMTMEGKTNGFPERPRPK